ncbi:MAG: carboxyl-terminal processing protease [Kiritimatiellia bacterium]|jgi:carboxyl-terminal processing protease
MRTTTLASLLVLTLFGTSLGLGMLTGQAAANRATDPYAKLGTFGKVFHIIESRYVDDIDDKELLDAAIGGMLDHLDAHTRWLDEDDYRSLREHTEGRYEGIGIEVQPHATGALIKRILPGGPAERDGLAAKDIIVEVNGISLAAMTIDQISSHLQGKRGTAVDLRIQRPGADALIDIHSVRDRIEVQSTQRARLPGDIAYVRLISFQSDSAEDVERDIQTLQSQGADKGLILDLRDNPGGLLTEAVHVVDLFVDEGTIVSTRGRMEGEQVHVATHGGFGDDLPVIILVNGMSASASEVVTGAMQDIGRATIIGTHTYGKGSVQTLLGVPDTHEGLKLTIARYYTPSGEPVAAKKGRVPDKIVPFASAHLGPRAQLIANIQKADGLTEVQQAQLVDLANQLEEITPEQPDVPWSDPIAQRWREDAQVTAALVELKVDLPSP